MAIKIELNATNTGMKVDKVLDLKEYPKFQYPNTNFREILQYFPGGKIPIFGYGSLMNKDSLGGKENSAKAATVKQPAVDSMRLAVAHDFKRLFNYSQGANSDPTRPENERAMLNLERCVGSSALGVVIDADIEDLEGLVTREKGYDLVPILTQPWDSAIGTPQIAYTFISPDEPRGGKCYTFKGIYPKLSYLKLIEDGLINQFGASVLERWHESTYLADGRTLVSQWDRKTFS